MASSVRQATDEEKGLARKLAEDFFDGDEFVWINAAERKYKLSVVPSPNQDEIKVLMPSGRLLIRDLTEFSWQLDQSLKDYRADPNSEIANALVYVGAIQERYSEIRGDL